MSPKFGLMNVRRLADETSVALVRRDRNWFLPRSLPSATVTAQQKNAVGRRRLTARRTLMLVAALRGRS
jgi:hypothetical protein